VKGDENVAFWEVARAIDIMRRSGIGQVGLITAKLELGRS
jgi:biopolymer transport protein ExbD